MLEGTARAPVATELAGRRPLFFTEEQAQQVAELGATTTSYAEETFALAVTGQLEIAAEWDTYLATLEGRGLPRYLEIHQDAYDAWRGH